MMIMLAAVMAFAFSANVYAQDQQNRDERGSGWMEKMKSARVAFLTTELDLSAEEAQAFWPVYNQAQEEKDAAFKATREAYRAMTAAVKDGKSDKEVAALLKAYLKAAKVPAEIDEEYAPEFLKVLPATKVAKLYASEEKFRKMQFQNFQGNHGGPGMREGQGRPEGGRGQFQGSRGPRDGQSQGPRSQSQRGGKSAEGNTSANL